LRITERVQEVDRDGATHRPILAIMWGARRDQLIAAHDECNNQCVCVWCIYARLFTHAPSLSFSLSLSLSPSFSLILSLTHSLTYSYLNNEILHTADK